MALFLHFTCPLKNGIHARPASVIEEFTHNLTSTITLYNNRTGTQANARSVLDMVAADVRFADACVIEVSGADEVGDKDRLQQFIGNELPSSDESVAAPITAQDQVLPRMLRNLEFTHFWGTVVVPGLARGKLVQWGVLGVSPTIPLHGERPGIDEVALVQTGLERLAAEYDDRLKHSHTALETALLKAQRAVARDPAIPSRVRQEMKTHGYTAAGAICATEQFISQQLLATGNPLLAERALDVRDVCLSLLKILYGESAITTAAALTEDSLVVAETLTPGQLLGMDRSYLKGLILTHAGTTSHTVILARSFGIPTLVQVKGIGAISPVTAILDGELGLLVTGFNDTVNRYYAMEWSRREQYNARIAGLATKPCTSAGGRVFEIAATLGTAAEGTAAFDGGAAGIGLFRTEMIFMGRAAAPTEDEQYEEYSKVVTAAQGKPVIIRTLDIGGDKPLEYLQLLAEENPFLGCRAIRLYGKLEMLFRTQIRALLRASCLGNLKIMIPMVCTTAEAQWVRQIITEEQGKLSAEGIATHPCVPVGAMIETPAAAFAIKGLSKYFDFFSIGTNDLLQYFMATDRANASVAHLYNLSEPGFLRLLQQLINEAHKHQRWIGMCGEMAGQIQYLPLLMAMGLDEVSVPCSVVPQIRDRASACDMQACEALLASALACDSANEVCSLLQAANTQLPQPILAPAQVILDVSLSNKTEVLKQLCDTLFIHGRTVQPRAVEEALWQRESTYSTAFAGGFAIPHCKSDAVTTNTLMVLRLKEPVSWTSDASEPVRVVILLAMRESDSAHAHMKVFAKLARKLMHDEFREYLTTESNPNLLCDFLRETLDLTA
ncbi:MAG: phosphoenolpyruvate--protein phosphotransferase [Verrucomicrobiota bacterium]|nr:phosphoenolpyruvate--protein phosphotransferase [Verrucomicrobiota bacterium]